MKRLAFLLGILAVSALAAWADTATMSVDDGPDEIVLKVYENRQVTFDHKGHAKRIGKCVLCHHKPDTEKCSECHEIRGDGETPSFGEAMHTRCKGCHKKSKEGLTGSCSECHQNVRSTS